MKKIINGRRYDTETAKKLGYWDNKLYEDLNFCSETLYQKSNGEYFLHCEGGANTRYARSIDSNSWAPGEAIRPLTPQAAAEWGEAHLAVDEYESVFGVPEDDSDKKTVSIRLTSKADAILYRLAAEWDVSRSEVVERLLTTANYKS